MNKEDIKHGFEHVIAILQQESTESDRAQAARILIDCIKAQDNFIDKISDQHHTMQCQLESIAESKLSNPPQVEVTDKTIMQHFKSSTEIINGNELASQCEIIDFEQRYREKENAYRSGWIEGRNIMFIEMINLQPKETLKEVMLKKAEGNISPRHIKYRKEQGQRELATGIIDKNGKEVLIGSTLRCEWIDENETPQISDYVVQFKFGMACIDITFTGDSGKEFGDFESIYEPVIKGEYYVV